MAKVVKASWIALYYSSSVRVYEVVDTILLLSSYYSLDVVFESLL